MRMKLFWCMTLCGMFTLNAYAQQSPTPQTSIATTSPIPNDLQVPMPLQVENLIFGADWSQFWPGVILEAIGGIVFGLVVAFVLYFLIDRRQTNRDTREAYLITHKVIERTIARLDYLDTWFTDIYQADRRFDSYDSKSVPNRLKTSSLGYWEKWKFNEKVEAYIEADFLMQLEGALGAADVLFERLNRISVSTAMNTFQGLKLVQAEALNLLHPLYKITLNKTDQRGVDIASRRQFLQRELIATDQRVQAMIELIQENQSSPTDVKLGNSDLKQRAEEPD